MKYLVLPLSFIILLFNSLSAQEIVLKKGRYVVAGTGKPFTGVYKEYDPGKTVVVSEMSILNGFLDGETKYYFLSGAMKEVRSYSAGKKNGTWSTWNEAGKKTAEASFKEGKKDGFGYIWDENGVLRYEMFYMNGEKSGTWIIRDELGNILSKEEFK